VILEQGLRVAVEHPGGVALVEDGELHAVETDEAAFRPQPQVSVARLRDRLDRVLREAVLRLPDLERVLGDGLARIERGGARGEEEQEERDRPAANSLDAPRGEPQ